MGTKGTASTHFALGRAATGAALETGPLGPEAFIDGDSGDFSGLSRGHEPGPPVPHPGVRKTLFVAGRIPATTAWRTG